MRKFIYIFLSLCRSRALLALILGALIMAVLLVAFVRHLPFTYQRSLAFLPLNIDPEVRLDAEATKQWRLEMREALQDVHRQFGDTSAYRQKLERLAQ